MRLALLSALADPPGSGSGSRGERPAFRRFAGKSVLAHQIDCAALLDCERVICHASPGPDLAAARAHASRAGIQFEIADSVARVQSLVTASDEVILILDGVLPDRAELIAGLAAPSTVLSFPAEPAVDRGFERLDASRAWSGALRTRGDCVARLRDLPPDCDLASSLVRIALQAGARVIELDAAPLTDGTWQRRIDHNASQVMERRWIGRQIAPAHFAAPGLAVIERIGLRLAFDGASGRWSRAPHIAALLTASLAALAGLAGWPVLGLSLLLATSVAIAIANVFGRVERLGAPPRKPDRLAGLTHLARDGLLVALLSMPIMAVPGWIEAVLPVLLIGLLWLGEGIARPRMRALLGDRILLLAVLMPLVYLGWTTAAVAAGCVATLAALLWTSRIGAKRLTVN